MLHKDLSYYPSIKTLRLNHTLEAKAEFLARMTSAGLIRIFSKIPARTLRSENLSALNFCMAVFPTELQYQWNYFQMMKMS